MYNPMDYSLPGTSIHLIFLARILEWFAISFSNIPGHMNANISFQYMKEIPLKSHIHTTHAHKNLMFTT